MLLKIGHKVYNIPRQLASREIFQLHIHPFIIRLFSTQNNQNKIFFQQRNCQTQYRVNSNIILLSKYSICLLVRLYHTQDLVSFLASYLSFYLSLICCCRYHRASSVCAIKVSLVLKFNPEPQRACAIAVSSITFYFASGPRFTFELLITPVMYRYIMKSSAPQKIWSSIVFNIYSK